MNSNILHRLEEGLITLLLASMAILVFVEVVLRFVFNTGLMWAQELTLHLSAWMVLFGASYCLRVGAHIGVDAVTKAMSPGVRRVVTAVAILCALAYCAMIMYGAWVYMQKMLKIGLELEDMPLKRWYAHGLAMLLGFGLIGLRLLQLLKRIITGQSEGFSLADEAKDSMKLIEEARKAAEKSKKGGGR